MIIRKNKKKYMPLRIRKNSHPPGVRPASVRIHNSPPPPPNPARDKVLSGSSIRKIKDYTRGEGDEHPTAHHIEALWGCSPLPFLTAMNRVELTQILEDVASGVAKVLTEQGMEVGLLVQDLGTLEASNLQLDVSALRSNIASYDKFGVSSISALQLLDVPRPSSTPNFGIEVQGRSLLFGVGAQRAVEQVQRQKRGKASGSSVEWLEWSTDEEAEQEVRRALRQVLRPPLVRLRLPDEDVSDVSLKKWKAGAPGRAFLFMMALSMLPLEKQMTATGRGKGILLPAIQAAQMRVKLTRKSAFEPLSRDGLVHHWFSELARLGIDHFTVPLVRLR